MLMMMIMCMCSIAERRGGRENKTTGLDPFRADQAVREIANDTSGTAEKNDLKTAVGIYVNMRSRYDICEMLML